MLWPKLNATAQSILMAAQNARGVCDKLGFKDYSHFIPLCYGFNLNAISA